MGSELSSRVLGNCIRQERPPAWTEGTDPDGSDGKSGLDSAMHSQGGYWLLLTWKPSGHRMPTGISVLGYLYINIRPYVHACKHKLCPVVLGLCSVRDPVWCCSTSFTMSEAGLRTRSPACDYQQTCGFSHTEEGADNARAKKTGWKTSKTHWIRQANRVGQPEKLEINRRL